MKSKKVQLNLKFQSKVYTETTVKYNITSRKAKTWISLVPLRSNYQFRESKNKLFPKEISFRSQVLKIFGEDGRFASIVAPGS